MIEGIYWAIENKVNIINMSFGMEQNSEALHKAIRDAYDAGILLVAAAGNDNHVEYPAAYDEFKVGYVEGASLRTNENDIEENEEEILSFEDVDYVEGRWYGSDHQETVIKGTTSAGITDGATIAVLKQGAIYPDKKESGFKGMQEHPCLHGYFKSTFDKGCNYINNYVQATKYALELGNGVSYSSPSKDNANNIDLELQKMYANINWIDYACFSASMKEAFAWEVAIHGATDVFAHSVYGYAKFMTGYSWTRFYHNVKEHGNDFADLKTQVPERFETAKDVAKNIVLAYKLNVKGTAFDFTNSNNYNSNKFKIYCLQDNLAGVGQYNLGIQMKKHSKEYSFK